MFSFPEEWLSKKVAWFRILEEFGNNFDLMVASGAKVVADFRTLLR